METTTIEWTIESHLEWVSRRTFLATDGYPVSGDLLRESTFDNHPTQPFRMPDLLWPAVTQ